MIAGEQNLAEHMRDLAAVAPCGFSVGLHIRFAAPLHFESTYPVRWRDAYAQNDFSLRDPSVFWGISQTGTCRWSAIGLPDPFGVLASARRHGLRFGGVASCGHVTSRTIIGVGRPDREFDDVELAWVERIARRLHDTVAIPCGKHRPMMAMAAPGHDRAFDEDQTAVRIRPEGGETADAPRMTRNSRLH